MERPTRRNNGPSDLSRYYGFKGAWDQAVGAFVFESQEERDRFQIATYGKIRMGFREAEEPPDDRPLIKWKPFWQDGIDQSTYEASAAGNPQRADEGPASYIKHISDVVTGEDGGVGRMPRLRMSQREWERRQWEAKKAPMGYFRDSDA